jgi:hypothetical protein
VVHDLRTGQPVGPGLRLPRRFDRLLLAPDGRAAVVVDDETLQLRIYSVSDGRCTLMRPLGVNSPAVVFSPAGDRVALRETAHGLAGILEVRDVATGRLVAAPLPTPSWSNYVEFSGDGRLLAVESNSIVRLLDVETGLPLGPWLPFANSAGAHAGLPMHDFRLTADAATLLTRADWPHGYLRSSRYRVWDLKPEAQPVEQLEALAELHAGRRLTGGGEVVPLSLDEYRRRWQEARGRQPGWFASGAAEVPDKVPAPPPVPKEVAFGQAKPPRPEQTPDYAAVFGKLGGTDRPPLASVAAAFQDKDNGVRRAALETALTTPLDRPLVLALLLEALKDNGLRDRAVDGLGSLGPEPVAASALLAELRLTRKHEEYGVGRVVRALGMMGPTAAEAVPELRELIASVPLVTYTDQDREAARALGRIGPAAGDSIPELVGLLLKYHGGNENAVVIRAIERVAVGKEERVIPHLAQALRLTPPDVRLHDDLDRRIGVAEMIGRLGPRARGTASALRAVLTEPPAKSVRDLLRPAAAEALWLVEGKADDALAVLTACLAEPIVTPDPNHSSRRGRAAAALGRIGEPAKSALPALREQLEKGLSTYDRLDAAEAVGRLTGDAKSVLSLITTVLATKLEGERPNKDAQARAIGVLAALGTVAKDAAPALAAAIRAEDEFNVRQPLGFRIVKADEEDEDPNTVDLIRRAGLPVLRQLDPAAARALEVPARLP